MPRGKKSELSDVTGNAKARLQLRRAESKDEWAGFVPCEVSTAEKPAFDAWYAADEAYPWGLVANALFEGLKLSVSFDKANDCYIASLSGRPDRTGSQAWNAVLTARAGDFNAAVALVMYKHEVILGGDWWLALNTPRQTRMQFG